MPTPAQYIDNSFAKQVLELVPVSISGTSAVFRVVYDGTSSDSVDANQATGIGYSIGQPFAGSGITLVNYNTYQSLYLAKPSISTDTSGTVFLDAAAATFGGGWPNLTSLPGTILEFSIEYPAGTYPSGPLSLHIDPSFTDTRFAGVTEYSDDARFPSLIPSNTLGYTAINSVGADDDSLDYFSILVPNGTVYDSVVLSSFFSPSGGSAEYTIYKAGTGDQPESVVAAGQLSPGSSSPSDVTPGQSLLPSGSTMATGLTPGLYTIKIENQSQSEVAYQLDFSSYISLPSLSGLEDSSISIVLPTKTKSNIPITWEASSLPSGFTLTINNGQSSLTGQTPPDFNGLTSSFSLTATETGTGGKRTTYSGLRLTIEAVNDAPELTGISHLTNGTEDTPRTVTYSELLEASDARDVDGEALNFRIVSILEGTKSLQKYNGLEFQDVFVGAETGTLISAGESLQWIPATNENGVLDAFEVIAVDASLTSSPPVTVSIDTSAVDDQPTDITTTSNSLDENLAAGSPFITLGSLDADTGDTFTYSLAPGVGDADNNAVTIEGDLLKINASPDFEVKSSYDVRIRSTDANGLSFEKEFTFGVNDVNEAPIDITTSNTSFDENLAAGSSVITLGSLDPDTGDTFSYSFAPGVGDADNNAFTIEGDLLKINASPDFEVKSSYDVRIRSTDANGLSFEKEFTFGVNDVNEAPIDITTSNTSFDENHAAGSSVITLGSLDPDTGDTFSYSFAPGVGDADNNAFTIEGNLLKINASPDFEVKSSYDVRIRSTDANGLSFEEEFTFGVNDVNEAPIDITTSNTSFDENHAAGSSVITLGSLDPDAGDTFTYSLVQGLGDADNNAFTIEGDLLKINASPDFEVKSSYDVRIRSTDANGLSFEKEFTFGVNDVNEAPIDITTSNTSFAENLAAGSSVITLGSLDPDAGDTFTYSLVQGAGDADNNAFTIEGDLLKINASPDFEVKSSYDVRIRSTDGGQLVVEKALKFEVIDVPAQKLYLYPESLAFVPTLDNLITLNGSYSQETPPAGNSFPNAFTAVLNYDGGSLDLATSDVPGLTVLNNDLGSSESSTLTISSTSASQISSFRLDFNVAPDAVGPFPFSWTLEGANEYEQITNSPITISPDAEAFIQGDSLDLSVFQTPLRIDTFSKDVFLLEQAGVRLPYSQAITDVRATALADEISVAQSVNIEAGAGDDTLDLMPLSNVETDVTVNARLDAGRDTLLLPAKPPATGSQIQIIDFELGFDLFQPATGGSVSRRSDVLAQAADPQSPLRQSAVSLRYAAIARDLDAGPKTLLSNQSPLVSSSIALDPGSDGRQLRLQLSSNPGSSAARIQAPAQSSLPPEYSLVVADDGNSAILTLPADFSLLTGLGNLRRAVAAIVVSAPTATGARLNLEWLDDQQDVLASTAINIQISPHAPGGGATPLKLDFIASAATSALLEGSTAGDTIQLLSLPTDQKTDKAFGGLGDDVLIAGDGDRLIGGGGADTMVAHLGLGSTQLSGGADNDLLIGGANDALVGGAGDDILAVRGLGNRLIGGSGADVFVLADAAFGGFSPGATAPNRILDFTTADTLAFNLPGLQRSDISLVGTAAGTLIRLSDEWSQRLGASDLAVLQGFHGVNESQLMINLESSTLSPTLLSRVDLIDQTA